MALAKVELMTRDAKEIIARYWSEEHNIPLEIINVIYDEEGQGFNIEYAMMIKK